MATVRAAEWVVGRWISSPPPASPWWPLPERFAGVRSSPRPFADAAPIGGGIRLRRRPRFRRQGSSLGGSAPLCGTASPWRVMLIVFGALFVSADRAFAELADDLAARLLTSASCRPASWSSARSCLGTGRSRHQRPSGAGDGSEPRRGRDDPPRTGWGGRNGTIALAVLDAVVRAFVAVQIAVFFGDGPRPGDDRADLRGVRAAGVLPAAGGGRSHARGGRRGGPVGQARVEGREIDAPAPPWRPGCADAGCPGVGHSAGCRCTSRCSATPALGSPSHAIILWMAAVFVLVMIAGLRMRAPWLPRATLILSRRRLVDVHRCSTRRAWSRSGTSRRFEASGRFDFNTSGRWASTRCRRWPPCLPGCGAGPWSDMRWRLAPADPVLGWNLARARAGRRWRSWPAQVSHCDIETLGPGSGIHGEPRDEERHVRTLATASGRLGSSTSPRSWFVPSRTAG